MYLQCTVSRLVLAIGITLLLLNGCTTMQPAVPEPDTRILDQARLLQDAGDYQGAAAIYLEAAGPAESPLKEEYLLNAVDSLLDGEEIERASLVMEGLSASDLPEPLQQHYTVNRARLALAGQQPDAILDLLQDPPDEGPYAGDYRALRGTALLMKKEYAAAAREFIESNIYITDPDRQLANQFSTWEAVSGLSDPELQQLRTAPPPDAFSGWLELVELTRLYLQQPDALGDVIPHWQMRYPGHPASEQFMTELLGGMRALGQPPAQVALLLPLSGKLAGAAKAIRDGLLAAYYDTPEDSGRPIIRIYDTGADPLAVGTVYQQAVADGARFVIGPLRKQAVAALMQLEQPPVPLLALNQVETTEQVNMAIYQFGLAPEDEAREVARRAMRDGHQQAITLVPEGEWGERVYGAFADEWLKLGGFLLEHSTYNPAETDHGKTISSTLNLDDSKARKTRLTRLLGQQLEFEPRRRQDVDFIFLLATPKQARLIRPQLSFFRASHVPVYSTSHVYSGYPDNERDRDINGLLFCDLPWILESGGSWQHLQRSVTERWPDNTRQFNRFYALGIDAWRITPYLNQLEGGIFGAYQGVTGKLSLDNQQQVHRTLRWAQIKNGLPYLLDTVPETGTGTATATE